MLDKDYIIDLDGFLHEEKTKTGKKRKVSDICRKYNQNRQNIWNWQNTSAPASVGHLVQRLDAMDKTIRTLFKDPMIGFSEGVKFVVNFCKEEGCEIGSIVKVKPVFETPKKAK